MGESFLNY